MTIVFALPGNDAVAAQLTDLLGATLGTLECRQFPDGESYLRLAHSVARKHVVLVCTLARPDSQILRLVFAADAARDLGARSVSLVAPYLAYMRQDRRFRSGEAISSRSFARLLSESFDRIVTVSPHLHRYKTLNEIYPIEAIALDASPMLAAWIAAHVERPLLVGPDSESEQWVACVARLAGAPFVVGRKTRSGDRSVSIELPSLTGFAGCKPVIVDDVVSSGETLRAAAGHLVSAGFARPVCLAVHGLQSDADAARLAPMSEALVTTDSIANSAARIELAPLIASTLSVRLAASAAEGSSPQSGTC